MAVKETGHLASRAIDDLYRQHGGEVYRYAYAVLGNHADAEDVTQTTFLNAYRSLASGTKPRKAENWLLTIAHNQIRQHFRSAQSRPREVELDERIPHPDQERSEPGVADVLRALQHLPPTQRAAIVMREFEGRSYAEMAEMLGVTQSAFTPVWSRFSIICVCFSTSSSRSAACTTRSTPSVLAASSAPRFMSRKNG